MRAGQLRHVISIQERGSTSDDMGGFTENWSNVTGMAAVRASINAIASKERMTDGKLVMDVTHRIKCRYRDGITADMRVKFGSRYFDIKSILNYQERNRDLEILAGEQT